MIFEITNISDYKVSVRRGNKVIVLNPNETKIDEAKNKNLYVYNKKFIKINLFDKNVKENKPEIKKTEIKNTNEKLNNTEVSNEVKTDKVDDKSENKKIRKRRKRVKAKEIETSVENNSEVNKPNEVTEVPLEDKVKIEEK